MLVDSVQFFVRRFEIEVFGIEPLIYFDALGIAVSDLGQAAILN